MIKPLNITVKLKKAMRETKTLEKTFVSVEEFSEEDLGNILESIKENLLESSKSLYAKPEITTSSNSRMQVHEYLSQDSKTKIVRDSTYIYRLASEGAYNLQMWGRPDEGLFKKLTKVRDTMTFAYEKTPNSAKVYKGVFKEFSSNYFVLYTNDGLIKRFNYDKIISLQNELYRIPLESFPTVLGITAKFSRNSKKARITLEVTKGGGYGE